jgi:hypothetical protein
MSQPSFSDRELEAYLDEALDAEQARRIEQAMKTDATVIARMSQINRLRDAGVHTLGEIWRQHQIGVPDRSVIGQYLLGVLAPEQKDYIDFRLDVLKCPYTMALVTDLRNQQAETADHSQRRRGKYYESSAGLLRNKRKPRD